MRSALNSDLKRDNKKLLKLHDEMIPAWRDSPKSKMPVSIDTIMNIFETMGKMFGFQLHSMQNMFEHLMSLLDSRASRMGMDLALATLHADYIGGENANFRKWYLAAQLDVYDAGVSLKNAETHETGFDISLELANNRWRAKMRKMPNEDRMAQIILYLLCWGEANQVRFMPECLAFIFKCANDHYFYFRNHELEDAPEGTYLDNIITPLYNFLRDQVYEKSGNKYVRREKDHANVIGYDDVNQLFWYHKGLERLHLADKEKLVHLPVERWYESLKFVDWNNAFYKTYRETRSWLHMAINFNRIWIIHISVFWFYTAFNSPSLYTLNYDYTKNNQPPPQVRWTIVALGGGIGPLINIVAIVAEYFFVPRRWPGAQPLFGRFLFLVFLLTLMVAPSVYILKCRPLDVRDTNSTVIAAIQTVVAIILTLFFSIVPLGSLFGSYLSPKKNRKYLSSYFFTASFHSLLENDRLISYGLWICIFVAKLTESYFFLTLSLRDPIRELSILTLPNCIGDVFLGPFLCRQQARVVLISMLITDLVLFFLDSYLWYIIFNTLFSVARSFFLGASIWTPWRNIYSNLIRRIYSKVLCTQKIPSNKTRYLPLVASIWNNIVFAMYREHLIPVEQTEKLVFQPQPNSKNPETDLREPEYFLSQEDQGFHASLFEAQSEAERRISFFAQSLTIPFFEACPVESMPSFTVLIPHYNERIMLGIREVIRGENDNSKLSILEYLKRLHPKEWECFVAEAKRNVDLQFFSGENNKEPKRVFSDLPYYCIGFQSSEPQDINRTRVWASLRAQTLYRTISGFMNYSRAVKLLYLVENYERTKDDDDNQMDAPQSNLEQEAEDFEYRQMLTAARKFRLLVSMQKMSKFSNEAIEDTEKLMLDFPEIKIVFLEECPSPVAGEGTIYYSSLIDSECAITEETGRRIPKLRIRLSGNPILGDGKGDNQNHALIFYRGEYIQLVDANQDNYLEECLKIRSVLAEFEEIGTQSDPYDDNHANKSTAPRAPVAILGAREYIFSENIGVLGDVAAGKEQTFGTLFARTLAKIGGKLHYGHPDFLSGIFMTTRGGVSKAQKGLHLNEDIYAGMNAILRGGRIKHSEHIQCGKGRDLGFGSILNFTSKIGAGMGEQMLSREYFYLGTQLPLDRFLSFYYAHPGFHINNMFIVISLELFLVVMLNLAALAGEATICDYDPDAPKTDLHTPPGCQNLIPLFNWVERCVLSIFVVFFISFLPLFVQELTERGFWRSVTRLGKHLASLSPVFEVFVCQIYARSLIRDLSLGGARYVATGRGFATTRERFTTLYTRYATASMYFGARCLLILLFISVTVWKISLLWFWVTTVALCLAPMIYNPHQFAAAEFFLDYRQYIRWLFRGNSRYHDNSWIAYVRHNRALVTGYKRRDMVEYVEDKGDAPTPKLLNVIFPEVIGPFAIAAIGVVPYLYVNSLNDWQAHHPSSNPILRLAICAFGPLMVNSAVIIAVFVFSCFTGCIRRSTKIPSTLSTTLHIFAVINHLAFFEIIWLAERWNFRRALLGLIATILVQSFVFKAVTALLLTKELKNNHVNSSWWTGSWAKSELGWLLMTQPVREFVCKVMEMSYFAMDFALGHWLFFIQTPLVLIPYVDKWHSMMVFWLKPGQSSLSDPLVKPTSPRKKQRRLIIRYSMLYTLVMLMFLGALLGPSFIPRQLKTDIAEFADSFYPGIVRPLPRSRLRVGYD
jgi:1,3-beta-glucan synthase